MEVISHEQAMNCVVVDYICGRLHCYTVAVDCFEVVLGYLSLR